MARKGRGRLSKLIRDYRGLGGGTPDPTSNSRLAGFKEWLNGQRSIEVTNKLPANGRKLFKVTILPFGADVDAGAIATAQKNIVKASAYSLSGFQGRVQGITAAEAGHLSGAAALPAEEKKGFYPALFKASYTAAGASQTSRRSGITNQLYDYTYHRTFAIPFGRVVATPEEDYVERSALIAAGIGGTGFLGVSFEEEVYASSGSNTEFAAGNVVAVN